MNIQITIGLGERIPLHLMNLTLFISLLRHFLIGRQLEAKLLWNRVSQQRMLLLRTITGSAVNGGLCVGASYHSQLRQNPLTNEIPRGTMGSASHFTGYLHTALRVYYNCMPRLRQLWGEFYPGKILSTLHQLSYHISIIVQPETDSDTHIRYYTGDRCSADHRSAPLEEIV